MTKEDKDAGILRPRDQKRIDRDPEKYGKSKKNTRRWCKGVVGRKHERVTSFDPIWGDRECGPSSWMPNRWSCYHRISCSQCGKEIKWGLGKECPDLKENE